VLLVVQGGHVPGVGQDGSYLAKAVSSRNVELGHKGAFRRVACFAATRAGGAESTQNT
jgi:hypothetical protein